MSLKVTINFEDTFPPNSLEPDFSGMTFISPQKDGSEVELFISIKSHPDPELPNVYNLGFGPTDGKGGFQDDVKLRHADIDKVFSTFSRTNAGFHFIPWYFLLGFGLLLDSIRMESSHRRGIPP